MGWGDRVQQTLVEEGGSVLLGERSDFDKERMITDLSFGDQWLASYHDGLDFADQYKGRLIFYPKNGSFLLRDLTQGDSGNYTYSVHQAINGKRNKTQVHIHLTVREQKAVMVDPRGVSPGHRDTTSDTKSLSDNAGKLDLNSK
ncbi:hypothetical protein XELAEV_18004925mg [Xenopus laevis]|uniref:Uncharacterized protein n=1 Tax=Xenopus laevis TaxID=8355 RepID=A0A974DVZ3_XENLA|nr:hypothetical protein XELAEV_18004925mg [Xenopus laevis]